MWCSETGLNVTILYNEPSLPTDHADYASEAGVLESVEAVEAALTKRGHEPSRLGVLSDPRGITRALQSIQADVVVNLFEGLGGVGAGEPQVTGLLELLGIPFTGCGSKCLALVREKALTKWLLLGAGLPSAAFHLLTAEEPVSLARFERLLVEGPLIVKPAREDGSLGIGPDSIVSDTASLGRQIQQVRLRYGDVLVEQYIAGREFNVGVLALPEPRALPLAEIEFSPGIAPLVSYDAKWTPGAPEFNGTPARCPAAVTPELAAEICRVARAAFRLTDCRHCARVDLRVDAAGRPYILEVNGNPDISPSAGLARQIRAAGMSYDEFVWQMVEASAVGHI
jgi:D-alanine-D-alanine ligase